MSKPLTGETIASVARRVVRAALAVERETGIPAELTATQAILESGWLQSAPGNNPFGHKAPRETQGGALRKTTELFTPSQASAFLRGRSGRRLEAREQRGSRTLYTAWDWFAVYPTLKDAFWAHATILALPRYKPALDAYREHRNFRRLATDIAAAGYATASADKYGHSLDRILQMRAVQEAFTEERGKGHADTNSGARVRSV